SLASRAGVFLGVRRQRGQGFSPAPAGDVRSGTRPGG
ncbi:MAG: hypothetical protein QOD85_800, partial [Gaiellaceae bacterium]|nr:hypothetical protein [Gaiellaceae bacterium]